MQCGSVATRQFAHPAAHLLPWYFNLAPAPPPPAPFLSTLASFLPDFPAAAFAPVLAGPAGFLAERAFASLAAASCACFLNSGFCAFFFLISSNDIPTMAFWNFCALRVRFLADSSALPFLFMRLQACVQRSFTGLIRWWKRESAFA